MSSGVAAQQLDLQVYTPASTQDRSADVVSSNVLKLKKSGRKSKSASYLGSLRSGALSDTSSSDGYGTAPLENLNGFEYIVEMEWDGQPFEVIVDTGSSDTWLVQAGFTCVDYDENEQPVSRNNNPLPTLPLKKVPSTSCNFPYQGIEICQSC